MSGDDLSWTGDGSFFADRCYTIVYKGFEQLRISASEEVIDPIKCYNIEGDVIENKNLLPSPFHFHMI